MSRPLAAVPEPGPLRDGVYIRVSAVMGRDDDRFLSPDLQREAIGKARAGAPGPSVVVAEESDIDVSGGSMVRPGLGRLLELATGGGLDRLWVYDLSRWARVADEGLAELKRIEALGCRVFSTAEQVDLGTPEGYFNATLMLAVHELRRRQIGRSWSQVHANRAGRGLFVGGTPPIGYRREDGRLVAGDEAAAVARVFARYAGGERIHDITRAWNAETGRDTSVVVIKRMLSNPVYVGRVRLKGQVHEGAHDGLVEESVWDRVQTRLAVDRRTPARVLNVAHALSGLVFCGECGSRMTLHPDRRPGETSRMECRRQRDNHTCSGPGSPAAVKLEALVLHRLGAYLEQLRLDTAAEVKRRAAAQRHEVDAGRLRREVDEQRKARARLAVSHARGVVDDQAYADADEMLRREVTRLEASLAEVQHRPPADVGGVLEAGRFLLEQWEEMTVAERHRAMAACVRRVEVARGERRGALEDRVAVTFL